MEANPVKDQANSYPDSLDSKTTSEKLKLEEEKWLSLSYVCTKCGNFHMCNYPLDGSVCFPIIGNQYCDGVLRKATLEDLP